MSKIDEYREEIDKIDDKFRELFEKRIKIVEKIGNEKKKKNISVEDKNREKTVIEKNLKKIENKSIKSYYEDFLKNIIRIYSDFQKKEIMKNKENVKVGYPGVKGSYSYKALKKYFNLNSILTKNFNDFEDVLIGIDNNYVKYGILPLENSSTGEVNDTYDLIRKYDFYIIGEIKLKIEHNLLGVKGATLDDISEVYSHIQGLKQSSKFLKGYKHWRHIPYHNTAVSAKFVKDSSDKKKAAIASMDAKEIYDLEILAKNINNSEQNYTKFVIIGKNIEYKKENDRISVVFTITHEVGALSKILLEIAEKEINMLSIKSRPVENTPWEYYFYVDLQGNLQSEKVKKLIKIIEEKTNFFKILGEYKEYPK